MENIDFIFIATNHKPQRYDIYQIRPSMCVICSFSLSVIQWNLNLEFQMHSTVMSTTALLEESVRYPRSKDS